MPVYLCIDLKSFYASVECVERNLSPLTAPLIVSDIRRGPNTIVLAVSIALKKKGVKGHPRLKDIDPKFNYIIAKPRIAHYIAMAAEIYAIYLQYFAPEDIHVYSIDEVFIDVSSYLNLYNKTALQLAQILLQRIKKELGLPACCGIGTNLFLAKVALDLKAKKESNIAFLNEQDFITQYGAHQPLSDFWHIGINIMQRLAKINLHTFNDIRHADPRILKSIFGVNYIILKDHASGIEPTTIAQIKAYRKKSESLSKGITLTRSYTMPEAIVVVKEIAEELALELRSRKAQCSGIALSLKYSNHSLNASTKINDTSSLSALKRLFVDFFHEKVDEDGIIKISLSLLNLSNARQLSFLNDEEPKLLDTILAIRKKFGAASIMKMTSIQKSAAGKRLSQEIGGHNAK